MQAASSSNNPLNPNAPLWSLGFRPFFLLGAFVSVILMITWPMFYRGIAPAPSANLFSWHGHEMIFGYTLAIIAGFLLTAVRNWTSLNTASQSALMGLAALWLLPRFTPVLAALNADILLLLQILDLLFIPALAFAIGVPIIKSENWRNLVIVIMLTVFAFLHLAYYLAEWKSQGILFSDASQFIHYSTSQILMLALELIMVLIALIGARVLPMFTRNGTKKFGAGQVQPKSYERAPWLLMGLGFTQLLSQLLPWQLINTLICFAFAAALLINLAGWQGKALWKTPLLWVIHIGYFGVALGFIFKGLAQLDIVAQSVWIHTMALLAVGMMTLGFIGRVSLGHSGRALEATPIMIASYGFMLAAAIIRVLAAFPIISNIMPVTGLWDFAALCWSIAMLLFVIKFTAIMLLPRPA